VTNGACHRGGPPSWQSQAIALSQTLRALACLPKAAVRDTQRMIDVATPERAEEIAARRPDAQHWGIGVRALMPSGGEED
jgi:hypothetical protein